MSEAAIVQDLNSAEGYEDRSYLQLVPELIDIIGEPGFDAKGRPARLNPEESTYLLERGPYVGRLHAQQTLLAFVQKTRLVEGQSGPTLPEYVEVNILEALALRTQELKDFDAPHVRKVESLATPARRASPRTQYPTPHLRKVENPITDLSWQEDGLCMQTDPEAFFPEKGGSTKAAKQVCVGCEVRAECLQYALNNDERFGIWGGLSERERRKLKKQSSNKINT